MREFDVRFTAVTDDDGFVQCVNGEWEAWSPDGHCTLWAPLTATVLELKRPFEPGYYRMISDGGPPRSARWYDEEPTSATGAQFERVEVISKGLI